MEAREKLTEALIEAGAPATMVDAAVRGAYDDFESESPTPILDLVRDCRRAGLEDIARRAMKGEFDAGDDEA